MIYTGSGKAESTIGTNGKTTRKGAVAWKNTRCAKILKTVKPGTSYFHRKSLVASEGDVAHLNSHVGFCQATNGQVSDFGSCSRLLVHKISLDGNWTNPGDSDVIR
jgi:hypothetical protein